MSTCNGHIVNHLFLLSIACVSQRFPEHDHKELIKKCKDAEKTPTTYDYLYTLLIVLIKVSNLILNWQYHTAMHEVTSQEACKILGVL